ncbi:heavy-metal-associated domain-containing protein [Deinococcus aestuarii]|uniref:heavy-metal-associated domain-containing protein n=1 Tax=Deinococcus aestuarii TaxID=2774531 RepID=UPI001C0E8A1C|nr:heavy-metal-associated domain-containing protein [Deinococcus aestuarii]
MTLPPTLLDYHVARMDSESRAQDVVRIVARLPGARHIKVDVQTQHLHLELDETQTPRYILENNLLLLAYEAHPFPSSSSPGAGHPASLEQTHGLPGEPSSDAPAEAGGIEPFLGRPAVHTSDEASLRPGIDTGERGRRSSRVLLLVLLVLAVALTLWGGWALAHGADVPPPLRHLSSPADHTGFLATWLTAAIALRVTVGLVVVALLLSGWLSRDLRRALTWLAAGVFGDALALLLDRAANVLLTVRSLAPLVRRLEGPRLAGAHLPDALLLVGVVGMLLTLRRSPLFPVRRRRTSPPGPRHQ